MNFIPVHSGVPVFELSDGWWLVLGELFWGNGEALSTPNQVFVVSW